MIGAEAPLRNDVFYQSMGWMVSLQPQASLTEAS